MKAVILCGGMGSRIREASGLLPKPMLPIGGKPILWHIMKGLHSHGITEFVLCLGYKGWVIKEFFLNYRAMISDLTVQLGTTGSVAFHGRNSSDDWTVTLAETGETTMTGGRVAAVRRYVEGDEPFLLTYGDGVSDVDVGALVNFHHKEGRTCTMTAVRPPGRFGELVLSGNRITEFNEKPQTSDGFINGGFMICDGKRFWNYLDGSDASTVLELEPLQRLSKDDQLCAYRHTGFWQPMDTLREYNLLNDLWAKGAAPWKNWKP